jgi:hypothetical protein
VTYLESKIENGKSVIVRRVVETDIYVAITRKKGGDDFIQKMKKEMTK